MRKYLLVVSLLHISLVMSDIFIYDYQQLGDSPRYIQAANEFLTFNISPAVHCNTAPGYPLFLALIKLVTQHSKYLIAAIQAAFFCFALYFFLNSILKSGHISKSVFKLSYFLILVSPEVFQTNSWTLTESICSGLLLFVCGCLFTQWTRRTTIIFSIGTALLVLTKFEYALTVILLLLFLILKKSYTPVIISVVVLSFALFLNGYKNLMLYNKFNLTSFGSGTVLYGGNNKNGDGSWHMYWVTNNYVPDKEMMELKKISSLPDSCVCVQEDSLLSTIVSWQDGVKSIPVKLAKLWLMPASFDFYTGQTEIKKGLQLSSLFDESIFTAWYAKYKHGFYLAIYWVYLLFICAGFFLATWNNMNRFDYLAMLLFISASFLYGVLFYGLGRFHAPVFPFMIIYFAKEMEYISIPRFDKRYFII